MEQMVGWPFVACTDVHALTRRSRCCLAESNGGGGGCTTALGHGRVQAWSGAGSDWAPAAQFVGLDVLRCDELHN